MKPRPRLRGLGGCVTCWSMYFFRVAWVTLLTALLAPGCRQCDQEGCEALSVHMPESGTGIAGVVARQDDVVVNGCQGCSFAEATLDLWRVDKPVATQAELEALLSGTAPERSLAAHEQYAEPLAAGEYVLCALPACTNVAVVEGRTTTVNVKRREGPTSFFASGSASEPLTEDFGLTDPRSGS